MSGYDRNRTFNTSLSLMKRRFGIFFDENERPKQFADEVSNQEQRLRANGGYTQRERMVYDKRRSLDRALKYSYQSAKIRKIQCSDGKDNRDFEFVQKLDNQETTWALINPDKNKMDYDDKIVSVHYEDNYHPGDVFEWVGTNSYWMIYLQDLTETAYFRGEIRRCSYEIAWQDEDGNVHNTYAAVRGPVETKIDYIQKHGISVDNPNYSLDIYLPRTKETLEYFRRYAKFYLKNEQEGSPEVCWRVEATDWISTPGILEVVAVEYYINETEDDLKEGVAGGLIMKPIDPNSEEKIDDDIQGETFIKPNVVYKYTYRGLNAGPWSINSNSKFVKMKVNKDNPLEVYVKWECSYSGQFELCWGKNEKKTIVVESLF